MKGKIMLLAGGAVGYVLGTAAGRERYEEIKSQATSLWNSPKVQEKAAAAQDLAKEKAPIVKDKAAGAAASASSAAKDKVSGSKSGSKDSDISVESLGTTDTAVVVDVIEPAPYPPTGI